VIGLGWCGPLKIWCGNSILALVCQNWPSRTVDLKRCLLCCDNLPCTKHENFSTCRPLFFPFHFEQMKHFTWVSSFRFNNLIEVGIFCLINPSLWENGFFFVYYLVIITTLLQVSIIIGNDKVLEVFGQIKLSMLKETLAHLDYKIRHWSNLSFLLVPAPQRPLAEHVKGP
jgi:hypothetical protein